MAPPTRLLPELRTRSTLRRPGFVEARTTGLIRGEFNIYPILLRPINPNIILGYREVKGSTGVERNFSRSRLYTALLVNVQENYPFTYLGTLDASLGNVALRYLELETDLSFRDSGVHPHKGVWIGNNLQFAGGPMGGAITDIKEKPEVRN
jgi:hypothetical protein